MTIADNYAPTKQIGDGSTTEFTANWNVFNEDYLQVIFQDVTTNIQTIQTTGFTVSFTSSSVTVEFDTAPTSSVFVILARSIPIEQVSTYATSRGFQGRSIENALDLLTAIVQDLEDDVERSPKTPVGSTPLSFPEYSAGRNLGWSETTENEIVNSTKTIQEIDAAVDLVNSVTSGSGVLVSANDTTIGFLSTKIIAGNLITTTINNPSGVETLTIDVSSNPDVDSVILNDTSFSLTIDTDTLTDDRSVNFQDASGTVALTSDINPSVGVGQTWQNVTGSRSSGVSYQNTTGSPIMVSITASAVSESNNAQVSTDNSTWVTVGGSSNAAAINNSFVVPNDHYYRVQNFSRWTELR